MQNPVLPMPCEILKVHRESGHEWTFRVATDAKPQHGQFMQLSIPKVGEAPISVSAQGEGWLEFTIRSVGRVTDCIFSKQAGDVLFLRGPTERAGPWNSSRGNIWWWLPGVPASRRYGPCCGIWKRTPPSSGTSI